MSEFLDSDITLGCLLLLGKDRMPELTNGRGLLIYNDPEWANLICSMLPGTHLVPAVVSWKQKNGPESEHV